MTQSDPTTVAPAEDGGVLDVLNCGSGHLEIKFDKSKPGEAEKAKRIIQDMLKRGYLLFVQEGNEQKRVKRFDPEHEVYILEEPEESTKEKKPTKSKGRRVPMRSSRATGIAPMAGG